MEQILVNLVERVDIIQLAANHLVAIVVLAITVLEVVLEQYAELVHTQLRRMLVTLVCVVVVALAITVLEVVLE